MLGLGVSYVMTFYVDACALVHFQFHPRSVGLLHDPSTTSWHFGAETKITVGKGRFLYKITDHDLDVRVAHCASSF